MGNLTITDIANEAGVSKTTVSRVLNNASAVDPQTRKRVMDVIEKRHYSPSAVAKSLSRRESSTIGVIVPEISNPFFGEALKGISEVIDRHNLTLLVCNTDEKELNDQKSLEMMMVNRVRGFIFTATKDYSTKEEQAYLWKMLKKIRSPLVLLDRRIDYLRVDGVFFDDYGTAYEATKRLIAAGHQRIAIINASDEKVLPRLRHQGYVQALKDAGITPEERFHFDGGFNLEKSYHCARHMYEMVDGPTAVLTTNNVTSMGFLKALYEQLEGFPGRIACIGFDKFSLIDIMGIPFNYIERDAYTVGRTAMELLINRIAFPNKAVEEIFIPSPFVTPTLSETLAIPHR